MLSRERLRRTSLAVLTALLGCGGTDRASESTPFEISDSAGVEVITHHGEPRRGLTADLQAELVLGGDDEGAVQLYRVAGAVFFEDGGLAVANGGTHEVLFFDSDGRLAGSAGREGEGPEEFSGLLWIQGGEAGEVIVYDGANRRLNTLDRLGTFLKAETTRVEAEEPAAPDVITGPGFLLGALLGTGLVAIPSAKAVFKGRPGPLPVTGELIRVADGEEQGSVLDTLVVRTWAELTSGQEGGPPIGQVFGAPALLFSAHGRWIAYSEADSHQITVLEDGRPDRVLMEAIPRRPFQPDSVPEYWARVADSLPAYRHLQVDGDGRVWVQRPPQDTDSLADWHLFSEDGRHRYRIRLPAGSQVLDASGDRVVILERDEFDVETVAIRKISPWPSP